MDKRYQTLACEWDWVRWRERRPDPAHREAEICLGRGSRES